MADKDKEQQEQDLKEKKDRYLVELQYCGTRFHGWQVQPNAVSVQEVLQECFSNVLRQEIEVKGCGRTDTGVHARNYVASFDAYGLSPEFLQGLVCKMNSYLPTDIRIDKIEKTRWDFNPRFDAVSRTYKYYICSTKQPFNDEFCVFMSCKLDLDKMNKAAELLYKYSDFTSFSKVHTQVNNFICHIAYAHWEQQGEYFVFTITADRFLRNMVRCIVGTLLEVGKGRIDEKDFAKIIEEKDRRKAKTSAPAKGLFLEKVLYKEEV